MKYYDTFMEMGFDELEVIIELEKSHLVEMKIPAGHQIKIMSAIKKMK